MRFEAWRRPLELSRGNGLRRNGGIFGAAATGSRGFSLLEIMITLVLLGIVAGMSVPALGRMLDGMKFREQTKELAAIVRYARLVAVSKGQTVKLRLVREVEECTFELSGPVSESRQFRLEDKDILVMDPGDWYFFPEGYATPGVMTFTREKRVARLRLDVLTGRPLFETE